MSSAKKPTRREFLVASSTAALGAATPVNSPAAQPPPAAGTTSSEPTAETVAQDLLAMGPQRTFRGDRTTQIAMPIGGIGAGSVCLNGYGGLQDFSIRLRPETSGLPEKFTSNSPEAGFAILHCKGSSPVTRLVEGPFPPFKVFDQGLQGQGLRRGGFEGFPRFTNCTFRGEYPIGEAQLSDAVIPIEATVTGWNPFIPLDDKNSGIPCAILEYKLHNRTSALVDYQFTFHLSHLAPGCKPEQASSLNEVIPGKGVYLSNSEPPNSEGFGSACLIAVGEKLSIKAMWLRSPGWEFDSMSALWREVSSGNFVSNEGTNSIDHAGRNGASILLEGKLQSKEERTHRILITWYFPNCYLREGGNTPGVEVTGAPGCRATANGGPPIWRPWYAGVWRDAKEVAMYVEANYASLRERTLRFKEALFSSTLPPYALDAISSNLAILKSPTVLRQENGNLWGWEGCFPDNGCCHGSCTHVWNYAQSLPHLYPQLERTLRDLELVRSMDQRGHVNFRGAIPDGPVEHTFHAAADGQLGGIMKMYRDWQISGDRAWMKRMYPLAKQSIDYCIRTWDPDRRGGLFEPHHNTYDIEFWGADGMCTSIYLGALAGMAEMAKAVGEESDEASYGELTQRAAHYMDEHLYNGEYFQQQVQYKDLRDTSFAKSMADVNEDSSEMQRLLKREGPKYQYGSGCLSDGVIGVWMAKIYGIETSLDPQHVRSSLHSIYQYNFKTDLSRHANAQRPGYAMGQEPGLLICSWPRGGKPTLPFVYSDEVWTGNEYQVASHLIAEGFVVEGLTIVRATRSRYDGRTRNPWNEYECGNYYARAMSSYALLGSLSGFRYSAVTRTLWFGPKLDARPFRTFFSHALGFGTITLDENRLTIRVMEGRLDIEEIVLMHRGESRHIDWKKTIKADAEASLVI